MDLTRSRDFSKSVLRLFELSRSGKNDEALGLALEIRRDFPDKPAETNYLLAALYARMGQPVRTVEIFESALEAGMGWNEAVLRESPSLAGLQEDPRFKAIVRESAARVRALEAASDVELDTVAPERVDDSALILMPLHGGADRIEEFAPYWRPASNAGVVVCTPQSSQRRSTDTFWWGPPFDGFDQERSEADVTFAFEKVRREFGCSQVIFGGFSQGAVLAVTLALQQRPVPSRGFICVGPGISNLEPLLPLMDPAAARGLRGWIVAGELEPGLQQIVRLHHELTSHGVASHLEVVPGLGHEFPPDFGTILLSAVDFVLRSGATTTGATAAPTQSGAGRQPG
jgi:predicted esterase